MTWMKAKLSLPLGILVLLFMATPALASMVLYQRGPKTQNPHHKNRFNFAHPQYQARKPNTERVCVQNGRALCLTKDFQRANYNRHPNGTRVKIQHPHIRKIFPAKIKRVK